MAFPPPYILDPPHGVPHTHTIILFHGRSSTAQEFATDLFLLRTSAANHNLRDSFPSVRWVFPDAGLRWCTVFDGERSAWFDTVSLDDLSLEQERMITGLRDGIRLVGETIESEVDRLGGKTERLILGGFSQGSAVALWSLFTGVAMARGKLGGFVGLSAWMPFTREAMGFVSGDSGESSFDRLCTLHTRSVNILGVEAATELRETQCCHSLPVYLGHGRDDSVIGIENCHDLSTILTAVGAAVEVGEYTGADRQGHWIKGPEQVDDVVRFIGKILAKANQ